jgi:hypothetical protein
VQLPPSNFDSATVALMGRVCDEAWQEIQGQRFYPTETNAAEAQQLMAMGVLMAVFKGERDPDRLKRWALNAALSGEIPPTC